MISTECGDWSVASEPCLGDRHKAIRGPVALLLRFTVPLARCCILLQPKASRLSIALSATEPPQDCWCTAAGGIISYVQAARL